MRRFLLGPLVAALILNVAGAPLPELARPADDFVESIGVCTHWNYSDTPYGKQYERGRQLLKELGVRYIRDSASPRTRELYHELGIRTTAVAQPPLDKCLAQLREQAEALAAIEGPNETNGRPITYRHVTRFPDSTRSFQDELYAALKADPQLRAVPVIAPSMAWFGGNLKLAPLASYDFAVTHSYPGGRMPSNLDREIDEAGKLAGLGQPLKRIVATESGYHTACGLREEGHQGVSQAARAKYLPRLVAEYYRQGIVRTYLYEFICSYEVANRRGLRSEAKYGLVAYDMTPTPGYLAMQQLIARLQDPGEPVRVQALDLELAAPDSVHRLLLQKRDGSYHLLLWNEVPVFEVDPEDPRYGQDLPSDPVPVTLTLPAAPLAPPTLARLDGTSQPLPAQAVLQFAVPDEVVIVGFRLPERPRRDLAAPRELTAQTHAGSVDLAWQAPAAGAVRGYFVSRLGRCLGFTERAAWQDAVSLPGSGYEYQVQAVDPHGNLSPPIAILAMTPAELPDLAISDLACAPAEPKPGQEVRFRARIANAGKYPSPALTHGVAFRIDGRTVAWFDARRTPLAPGAAVVVEANSGPARRATWTAVAGQHLLSAQVDDQDRIREADETNNTCEKRLRLSGDEPLALPDLVVTAIILTPAQPRAGDAVSFAATVKNTGAAASPKERHGVAFRIDGAMVAWGIVSGPLAPGQELAIKADAGPAGTATWKCDGQPHRILAHVDDVDRIWEANETNNQTTLALPGAP